MKQTTLFLTAATLCAGTLCAAPIQAQSPFAYEFGLLGQATRFEQLTTLGNRLGIGAQLGAFVLRGVAIEWSTDLAPNKSGRTGNSLSVLNNRVDLVYNHPIADRWRAMVGGGWTGTRFSGDKTMNEYDSGVNALLGLRLCVNDHWSWTGAALADLKDPADQTPAFNKTTTWTVRIGLSRAFGKNRTKGPCVNSTPVPLPPPPPPAKTDPAPVAPAPTPAAPTPQPQPQPPAPTPAPAPAPAPAPRTLMTFSPVHFSFDRVDLSNAAKDALDGIARFMTDNSNARIRVTGYTDSRGDDGYNARLGARRATVVKDYLVSRGTNASRIETMTKGEADPAASNDTPAGRAHNRRAVAVELR